VPLVVLVSEFRLATPSMSSIESSCTAIGFDTLGLSTREGLFMTVILNCAETDCLNDFVSTTVTSDTEFAEVGNTSIHETSTDSAREWSRDYQLDKVMARHLDGAVVGVRRLFNLVKQNRFEEMLLVHDELAQKEKEALNKSMDVVMYSRLMTRVRELGPQYVLPVFQRMLSVGVLPNVVPYTILVQAFMETVARVRFLHFHS